MRAQSGSESSLPERLDAIEAGLVAVESAARAGEISQTRSRATRLYLNEFEPIEAWWGSGGPLAAEPLATEVASAEAAFHALMATGDEEATARVAHLRRRLAAARAAAGVTETSLTPGTLPVIHPDGGSHSGIDPARARTVEFRDILEALAAARRSWRAGERVVAIARVEEAYLEGLEPLEPRLPSDLVGRAERAIHLGLRPRLARGAAAPAVEAAFDAVETSLLDLDRALESGSSFWFSALSAFAIIVREGLEAVLLIGAILAYLGRVSGDSNHRRQVWVGVAAGVLASLATWVAARTFLPLGGASRELIEGVTALLAVAVLLYVSHWLFQKAYIHDWKEYLREKVGVAVTTGSALAMAGLAFAAVYREGFETVLFYQALMFDAGPLAVAAGFVPGLLLIVGIGAGILRLGLELPLRKVFAVTNAILLYLAFVFLGKGLYNLQEAGLFAPHPVPGAPDHEALRQLLGFYPMVETILAQGLFLAVLALTYLAYRRRALARRTAGGRSEGSGPAESPRLAEESATAS
ncbi:MAG: FTR1 family iron permease [Gemmatimonadetes bacterium]|nr:FTR1 family iron permease [Gemmatimonadota bacterium]